MVPWRPADSQPSRRRTRAVAAAGVAALACAGTGQALAESDDLTPPPAAFDLPGATLKIEPSQISAETSDEFTFTVTLTRKLKQGAVELTLPRRWLDRSPDGKPVATTPLSGRASNGRVRVRRSARVVRFSFKNGRRRDSGSYTVADRRLAADTYQLRFSLRANGRQAATGTTSVVVLALPVEQTTP